MPLDQDPQDLRDRTYYLSNGVIRVAGRRVATNAANFTKGDVVGVVLDADQGEIVFFRNGESYSSWCYAKRKFRMASSPPPLRVHGP